MKNIRMAIVLVCVVVAGILYSSSVARRSPQALKGIETRETVLPFVSVTIDNGDSVATQSSVRADTALAALERAASRKGLTVKTKTYDFGTLVEEIGEKKNSPDYAWIYYINGQSATQAASLQKLQSGDSVFWKYEPPQF